MTFETELQTYENKFEQRISNPQRLIERIISNIIRSDVSFLFFFSSFCKSDVKKWLKMTINTNLSLFLMIFLLNIRQGKIGANYIQINTQCNKGAKKENCTLSSILWILENSAAYIQMWKKRYKTAHNRMHPSILLGLWVKMRALLCSMHHAYIICKE